LRPEPELFYGSGDTNLLQGERQRSIVLRVFVLAVLRVLNEERIDSNAMVEVLYGDQERDPNNIEQSLSKIFKPLRDSNPDLQRTVTAHIIRGGWIDITEFKTFAQAFVSAPPQGASKTMYEAKKALYSDSFIVGLFEELFEKNTKKGKTIEGE
jgi:hypothetical protein